MLRASLGAVVLLVACAASRAEQLPITTYSVEDGLPSDGVRAIVRDSRGYLWIGHSRFLSRFDGTRFSAYGREHGLPDGPVRDILETLDGTYLLATDAGIFRFEPRNPAARFAPLAVEGERPGAVADLLEDRDGRVWAATGSGLFMLEPSSADCRPSARASMPISARSRTARSGDRSIASRWKSSPAPPRCRPAA